MSMKLSIDRVGANMLADSKFKPFEPKHKEMETKDELLEMLKNNFRKSSKEADEKLKNRVTE